MNFNFDLGPLVSGFVGALVLYLILLFKGGEYDDDVYLKHLEPRGSAARNDEDEPYLEIEDLLHEDSPLKVDPIEEGNYLWWGEPYISDDQKVLALLHKAIAMIQAQEMTIEVLTAVKTKAVPLPPFPVLDDVVEEPAVPVAEVTETTHEAVAPNWSLVENKSEVETKLAPRDIGRPLSSPYDAWMFPRKD